MLTEVSSPATQTAAVSKQGDGTRRAVVFLVLGVGLILCGVFRSSVATRLDSFTIDEAWHIVAGVSYVRTGDFRLNPEHPPLTKLWVGAAFPVKDFDLPPLRPMFDKYDERTFTSEAVYLKNDEDFVQARARVAMLALHALLLLAFALAARRVLGDVIALAALAFLLIDPTVAAHLPLVMTDLPVALLSTTALLLAVAAFRSWRALDLVLATLALGLSLGAKHSGLITLAAVGAFGLVSALAARHRGRAFAVRARRLCLVGGVLLGGVLILWSFYGFRYQEARTGQEQFNRPLAEKIEDLKSPRHKGALGALARFKLVPRAYLWGLADTIRAGVEGRSIPLYFFGRRYEKQPFYFFPGVLLVKLPVGLIMLSLAGVCLLLLRRKLLGGQAVTVYAAVGLAALFLLALASANSAYAGVRHALPVFPPLALLGAVTVKAVLAGKSRTLRGMAALAALAALVSAIPVMRPWEYYNELAGGAENAYRYFNDEGLDLGQRSLELLRYYDEHLREAGEIPYDEYRLFDEERKRRGIRVHSWKSEDGAGDESDNVSGTFFMNAASLAPKRIYDYAAFRSAEPVARFGNLFVFRGTFHLPWLRSSNLSVRALEAIYSPANDVVTGERLLTESVELYPKAWGVALELGNLLAKRGARAEAIRAYEIARKNTPPGDAIIELLTRQIERVSKEPPESVPPLRNPWAE